MNLIQDIALNELAGKGTLALVIVLSVVQVSPIKLNPWTWIARKVGRAINGELLDKFDQLEQRVDGLKDSMDERAARDARTRILRFGDECLHGDRHSKEHFDQILRDITEYETYCDEHPNFKNNMAVLTIGGIKSNYQERLREHDFL